MIEFILPRSVVLPRKTKKNKVIRLNLNVYRNLHHHVEGQVKKLFKPLLLPDKFRASNIRVSYIIYPNQKRSFDIMNSLVIVDKYFLDWLVAENYIPDDSWKHVEYGSITVDTEGLYVDKIVAQIEILEANQFNKKPKQNELF